MYNVPIYITCTNTICINVYIYPLLISVRFMRRNALFYFFLPMLTSIVFDVRDDAPHLISDISGNEFSKTALKHVVFNPEDFGWSFRYAISRLFTENAM